MTNPDIKKTFYESARAELIQRIQLRDNIALLYLAAIATIFGIGLAKDGKLEILLIIPILSLAACVLTSQHHIIIGALAKYCSSELDIDLKGEKNIPQWDNSETIKHFFDYAMSSRAIGHFCIFIIPSVAALILNAKYSIDKSNPLIWLFYIGCLVTISSVINTCLSYKKRKDVFDEQIKKYSQQDS